MKLVDAVGNPLFEGDFVALYLSSLTAQRPVVYGDIKKIENAITIDSPLTSDIKPGRPIPVQERKIPGKIKIIVEFEIAFDPEGGPIVVLNKLVRPPKSS